MHLSDCHNIDDFRRLARRRLPWPVFDYIDGAADDEIAMRRNTDAFADCDLVPDVLAGVADIDTSVTVMGHKSALPMILSPTALQRLFHWQGERAVARAAEKFGLWFGISSLSTISIEEIAAMVSTPKMFQFYYHKDRGLNRSMLEVGLDWKMAEQLREDWGGGFCLKGIMSVADARRAVEIGADAIMISNHGGGQLDDSRAPFDQLPEIVDAAGGEIEIICDGGVRRGTHVLKALSAGATCASGGRLYLYALAAAGLALTRSSCGS